MGTGEADQDKGPVGEAAEGEGPVDARRGERPSQGRLGPVLKRSRKAQRRGPQSAAAGRSCAFLGDCSRPALPYLGDCSCVALAPASLQSSCVHAVVHSRHRCPSVHGTRGSVSLGALIRAVRGAAPCGSRVRSNFAPGECLVAERQI